MAALLIVLRRVAFVLLALELVYLGVANAVVRSQLIKDAVSSSQGFYLDYGRAYSLWPGHVSIRDFSLRVEDYNIQFELTFESAVVHISLSELLSKKFHATRFQAEGAQFRARHKLITVGDDAERVAGYPSIRGFADPPYFVGIRPPPIPDAEYDLWEVQIENVHARLSELWVMEYRFRGEAVASGAFVVKPSRWVQVSGAKLQFAKGRMTLGDHVISGQTRGQITFEMPGMDVQATEGLEVFGEVSTRIDVAFEQGQLAFFGAYLDRLGSVRYSGPAAWRLKLNIQKGVIQPGSQVSLLASPLTLRHPFAAISGDVMLSLARPVGSPERLAVSLSAPRMISVRERDRAPGPSLKGLEAGLLLDAVDLTREVSGWSGQVGVKRVHAPSLSWLPTGETELGGEAEAGFSLARDEAGRLLGRADLDSSMVRVQSDGFSGQAEVHGTLAIERAASATDLQVDELTLALKSAQLRTGDKRSKPFAVTFNGSGLRVSPGSSPAVRGVVRAHVSSAEALLPLIVGDPLREMGSFALDLRAVEARADLDLQQSAMALRQIDAKSGNLRVQGHVEKRAQARSGALLLSSGPINVGVTIKGSETELSPFVTSDWLRPRPAKQQRGAE